MTYHEPIAEEGSPACVFHGRTTNDQSEQNIILENEGIASNIWFICRTGRPQKCIGFTQIWSISLKCGLKYRPRIYLRPQVRQSTMSCTTKANHTLQYSHHRHHRSALNIRVSPINDCPYDRVTQYNRKNEYAMWIGVDLQKREKKRMCSSREHCTKHFSFWTDRKWQCGDHRPRSALISFISASKMKFSTAYRRKSVRTYPSIDDIMHHIITTNNYHPKIREALLK